MLYIVSKMNYMNISIVLTLYNGIKPTAAKDQSWWNKNSSDKKSLADDLHSSSFPSSSSNVIL